MPSAASLGMVKFTNKQEYRPPFHEKKKNNGADNNAVIMNEEYVSF